MPLKIPLHAALDCIKAATGCIKAALGCDITIRRWFNSVRPGEYVEENKAILKMRKVCHSFAYGELRFGLLEMIVITLSHNSYYTYAQIPEFWLKNVGSVKAVRINNFRDENICNEPEGIIRVDFNDLINFLREARDISFNCCGMSSKAFELISFSSKTHRVTLRWCLEIDDLSSLKNVHTIRLLCSVKNQPADVSVLEHCHTLITGVVPVIGVEKTNIRRFATLADRQTATWTISRTGDFWRNHPGVPITIPSIRDIAKTHSAFNQT